MGLLDRFRWLSGLTTGVDDSSPGAGPRFAVDIDPVMLYGPGYTVSGWIAPAARVDRRSAMQVPAVKRSRDLIPGTLGQLDVELVNSQGKVVPWELLEQPEPDVPRSVTITRTYEDLLFEERAWWYVLEFGMLDPSIPIAYPTKVRRLDPRSVTVTPELRLHVANATQQGCAEEWPTSERMIRFDSPNDGLLTAAARAIRTAISLGDTVGKSVDGAPPIDYLTPADPNIEPADDEVPEILANWASARRAGRTGYIPAGLKYETAGWNPEQLQLAEILEAARLEIALAAGIDPEEVGVSTTSRTYANQFDRRKQFTDFTLGAYRRAFEDRLRMADLVPPGFRARTSLAEFLRSDDKTRYEAYEIGQRVGAITREEIREAEGKPALPAEPTTPTAQEEPMQAATVTPIRTFAAPPVALHMDADGAQTFEVDVEKRVIRGLAVPYGGKIAKSGGKRYRFRQGSLTYSDLSRVKLWVNHNGEHAVGVMFEADDRPDGMYAAWRIARTPEGDKALTLAEDKVQDGLSVGLGDGGRYELARDGVFDVISAPWRETSLTSAPAFDDARVHSVAASAAHQEGTPMKCKKCGHVHADGVVECAAAPATGTAPTLENTEAGPDFSALTNAINALVAAVPAAPAAQQAPAAPAAAANLTARPVVNATGGLTFQVNEPPVYRFDGIKGDHDFSADLISGLGLGSGNPAPDGEAYARVMGFMAEHLGPKFVTTTDTTALNPTGYRPDMFVNEQQFATPLRDAFYKGALTDVTPFTFSKFNTASGLVGDHTQGNEPAAGSYSTATAATVTPTPSSGKVHITREVADQGGNPQVSALIWSKIVYEFLKAMENKVAAMLDASAPAELGAALAQGANTVATLAAPLEAAIAGLNFIAGGNRFDYAAAHIDLYLALAALKDGQGRPYYPIINPVNASGRTVPGYKSLDVAGTQFDPVWSLGATSAGASPAEKSYLADRSAVWFWHSAPQRLDKLQEKVEGYDLGVWGYSAGVISDITGLRKITYDLA